MRERQLIQELIAGLPTNQNTLVPAGDDCAVVSNGDGASALLLKVDAVVEEVHFRRSDSPRKVGRKALARCLSDVAAMGGTPDSALVSIGLRGEEDQGYVRELYEGLAEIARDFDVAVVGGETVRNPGGLFVSVSLTGRACARGAVRRSGARAGEAIFVSGCLGGASAGHHLEFDPRVRESLWLVDRFQVSAMIDVSDGLATDLGTLLQQSAVGATLDEAFLPISRAARIRAREDESAKSPLLAALTDGEDFELLFTVAASDAVDLKDAWRTQFPEVPLSLIGRTERDSGLRLKQKDGVRTLGSGDGYDHFQQS